MKRRVSRLGVKGFSTRFATFANVIYRNLFNSIDLPMRKGILFLALCFTTAICTAQSIDLEPASPAPQFQDADVGSIEFGDVDNDGDLDLMVTGRGGPIKSTLYKNDGSGNFSEVLGAPFENVFSSTVGFEDVDNDGDLDLLIMGNNSSPIVSTNLYQNDGTGNYSLVMNTPFEPSQGGDFAFGDVDNDGDRDLIHAGYDSQGQGFTKMYLNGGTGTFSEVMGTAFQAAKNSSVAFIDIENDNDLDVLIAGENNSGVPVTNLYLNDNSGNFSLVPNTPFEDTHFGDIAIGDSDNDGDMDILISGEDANGTALSRLYLNDGAGNFTLLAGTPFPGTIVGASDFADFDNDGDLDVLIVGAGSYVLGKIYENQGSNSFVLADTVAGAYLSSTAIGDIDGDNDIDLIISGTSFTAPVRSTKTYLNETIITATEEEIEQSAIVYPNPSNGAFHIDFKQPTEAVVVTVYNSAGELVYSLDQVRAHNQVILDQPAGLYFVILKSGQQVSTHRLLLAK